MSITKLKWIGSHWAAPPRNHNTQRQPLTGRVIVGMLTGGEGPDPDADSILTSARDRRGKDRS